MSNISVNKPTKVALAQSLCLEGKRVLDFGCGPGVLSCLLAARAREVVGVDHWGERIEAARKLAAEKGVKNVGFHQIDAREPEKILALGDFDVIVCWGVLHRVADPVSLLCLLGSMSPCISLEWRAPIIPFLDKISFAHLPQSTVLDKSNLQLGSAEKTQGDSKFWCPTISCVGRMMSFVGFDVATTVGVGDRMLGYWAGAFVAFAGFMLRLLKGESPGLPVARVFVTYSRLGVSLELDKVQTGAAINFGFRNRKSV